MQNHTDKLNNFKELHNSQNPLILNNIWDAGSAKAVQASGVKAIGTSSWAVAESHGYTDGQKMPIPYVLKAFQEISSAVSIPLTCDIEAGYGHTPDEITPIIIELLQLGVVGINVEDQIINTGKLYDITEQTRRLAAVRKMSNENGVGLFINARTDVFFIENDTRHISEKMKNVLERANAYADVGCDCIFVPNLIDIEAIKTLCDKAPIPVNIMQTPNGPTVADLTQCGVSRISRGPFPYMHVIQQLETFSFA